MEKKILLFNYFVKKVMEKEKELLDLQDDAPALMAVIFSKYGVQHRSASGYSSETAYVVNPKFAQELFIILCSNAESHGDHLKQVFNFTGVKRYEWGDELADVQDKDITYHLNNNLYPYTGREIDRTLFAKLLPKMSSEDLDNMLARIAPVFGRKPWMHALEQPEPCAETAMIDRAWERLMAHENFVSMLKPEGKQNYRGQSVPYQRYVEHLYTFLGQEY